MSRVSSLLHITIDVIKDKIPEIYSLCINWRPEYITLVQPYILKFLKEEGFRLFKTGRDEPTFELEYIADGRHVFVYHKPEVRVLCRKSGERMVVTTIKYNAKPDE